MAGARQLAGFPTVIGTLWSVSDENSAILAEQLYRGIVSEGDIDSDGYKHINDQ
jgi:CHAT domain-containing protein